MKKIGINREIVCSWASLAGDVGGMVGMMLGASVLSLFDDVVSVLGWAKRKVRPENKKIVV